MVRIHPGPPEIYESLRQRNSGPRNSFRGRKEAGFANAIRFGALSSGNRRQTRGLGYSKYAEIHRRIITENPSLLESYQENKEKALKLVEEKLLENKN